jgi:LPXTG-motif cell wall-anchored protein
MMMKHNASKIGRVVLGTLLVGLVAGVAAAETIEIKNGVILGVNGNVLTVRGPEGVKEYTVPEDFRFNMDGRMLSVYDLKPGMPIAAKITTTKTPIEMTTTEIKEAKIIHTIGTAFAIKTKEGETKKFSSKDIEKRQIVIYKDGKQISPYDLKKGDNISATIVTELPPVIITDREVEAFVAMPPQPRPVMIARVQRTPPPPPRQLPKTGSRLPWLGLAGLISLALGAGLTIRRVIAG